MKKFQENKLNMYYVVRSTDERFQSSWTGNAPFAASHNAFVAIIPLIEQNRDAQIVENTGVTIDKTLKRDTMTDKALFIANRVKSYATVTGNNELLGNVKYTASDMKKARDTDVVGICDTIWAKANANVAALSTYGVTAAMLTDLQAAITAYVAVIPKPRATRTQTKNATENIEMFFKQADDILTKRLDVDIEVFRATKPDFYSQYKTARIILGSGNGLTSVIALALEKNSGIPMKGVNFTFKLDGMVVSKKTWIKGHFRLPNLPEGEYTLTVSKIGCKTQILTVDVVNNETTIVRVDMEKSDG
ncbi:MAG: carboxypeptidase regulatory-like domain-containing protein [Bacteroidales bacterium]|jgi:hypothetical protein